MSAGQTPQDRRTQDRPEPSTAEPDTQGPGKSQTGAAARSVSAAMVYGSEDYSALAGADLERRLMDMIGCYRAYETCRNRAVAEEGNKPAPAATFSGVAALAEHHSLLFAHYRRLEERHRHALEAFMDLLARAYLCSFVPKKSEVRLEVGKGARTALGVLVPEGHYCIKRSADITVEVGGVSLGNAGGFAPDPVTGVAPSELPMTEAYAGPAQHAPDGETSDNETASVEDAEGRDSECAAAGAPGSLSDLVGRIAALPETAARTLIREHPPHAAANTSSATDSAAAASTAVDRNGGLRALWVPSFEITRLQSRRPSSTSATSAQPRTAPDGQSAATAGPPRPDPEPDTHAGPASPRRRLRNRPDIAPR